MKQLSSLVLLLLLLSGCSNKELSPEFPPPQELRILSLVTAADHIIAELGCREKIAGIDRHGRVLDSMKNVPVLVSGSMISREMLRKNRINCAVIWYYQQGVIELLNKENVSVMVVKPQNPAVYPQLVRDLGKLCGKSAEAESLVQKFESAFGKLPENACRVSCYVELYAPWKSPAADSYIDSVLQRAGGTLAVGGTVKGTVSPEAVVRSKPEVIFFVENVISKEAVISRAALRNTPAVKNDRVYAIPRKLLCEGVAPEELLKFFSNKIKDK